MEIVFKDVDYIINKNTSLEKTLLKNVNFTISEKGIYGILGNSNSGKTTILDLINALTRPTNGSVKICNFLNDGRNIKDINILRCDVGYVFKNTYDMFFNKTVEKEIKFGMKYFGFSKKTISEKTKKSLELVSLKESILKKDPQDLDLATSKKVGIACVLTSNPKIILLDEPTLGLNYKEKQNLIRLLKLLKNKYNKTIIISSKDTEFIYNLADYCFIMHKCRLVKEGKKELLTNIDLLRNYNLKIPEIVKFTSIINKDEKRVEDYINIKDLIKAVYRSVF